MAAIKRAIGLSGLFFAAVLFACGSAPLFAQERPGSSGHGTGEHAVPRGGGEGGGHSAPAPSGGGSSTPSSGGSSTGSAGGSGGGDHAISRGGGSRGGGGREGRGGMGSRSGGGAMPRSVVLPTRPGASEAGGTSNADPATGAYARPRGDRPGTGRAVPRDVTNVPIPPSWGNDYWNYWYSSYYSPYYRYGYAPCMPYYYGCFYYDPFYWDYYYGYGYTPGYYYGGGGGGYVSSGEADYDTGGLKLKVRPRDAQVYVDGYFSGVVDDYDGVFQKLKLRAGTHRVELRSEGHQPATLDVLIVAGETVTYRAELKEK